MPTVTFNISSANLARIVKAAREEVPGNKDSDGNPIFSDNNWAKEVGRRYYIGLVLKNERRQAGSTIDKDDGLLT